MQRKILKSTVRKENECVLDDFPGLTVASIESSIYIDAGKIANTVSLQGHNPDLIVIGNETMGRYNLIVNRMKMDNGHAYDLLYELAKKLKRCDKTCGGEWVIDSGRNMLQSPNHGSVTSLDLEEIVNVIREMQLSKQRQAQRILREGNIKEIEALVKKILPIGFRGKVEQVKEGVKITP